MIGGFPPPSGTKEERKLLSIYKSLNKQDQQTLLKFAVFLKHNQEADKTSSEEIESGIEPDKIPTPEPIERPPEESVIKAIKRLNKTYFMLDTSILLNQTSDLMTQHLLKGRDATSVIDELEQVFKSAYEDLL